MNKSSDFLTESGTDNLSVTRQCNAFLSDPSPIIEMLGLWSDQKYNKILQDGDSGFISPEQQGAGVTTTTGDLLNSANLLDFNKKEDGE